MMAGDQPLAGGRGRLRKSGLLSSVALAAVAVVLAILGGRGGAPEPGAEIAARFVSADELSGIEGAVGHPIYWAGPVPPSKIEITADTTGNVSLRYLPAGMQLGEGSANYLTVGTYPIREAAAVLKAIARRSGTSLGRVPGGGVVLKNPTSEGSDYLAYPGSDLEIEVYAPRPGRA